MITKRHQPLIIGFALCCLLLSAFYLRVRSYRASSTRTIDELVYYHLGAQLKNHFPEYHTQKFADLLLQLRPAFSPLPQYFYAPIFKHPPLFAGLISISLRLFGDHYPSALYVSALFGAGTILLVYWLGTMLFDKTVGLLAAVVLWLDPIHVIPGQKIWMATTLNFFMLLTVCLFIAGMIEKKGRYWIGCGAAAGLALLAKYPGGLIWFSVVLYSLAARRDLFKDKAFQLGITLPALCLLPWVAWNMMVLRSAVPGPGMAILPAKISTALLFLGLSSLMFLVLLRIQPQASAKGRKELFFKNALTIILISTLVLITHDSLSLTRLPETHWVAGRFRDAGLFFYLKQLTAFSPVYLLAFLAFLLPLKSRQPQSVVFLKVAAATIFLFFTLWRNYQCRYILPATPLLLVMGSALWVQGLRAGFNLKDPKLRLASLSLAGALSLFILLRMSYLDLLVSFPNDMCYY